MFQLSSIRSLIFNDAGFHGANKNGCVFVGRVEVNRDSFRLLNIHLIGDGFGLVRIKNVEVVARVDKRIPHVEFCIAVNDGFEFALFVPADVAAEGRMGRIGRDMFCLNVAARSA